jgi:hypothetical protein
MQPADHNQQSTFAILGDKSMKNKPKGLFISAFSAILLAGLCNTSLADDGDRHACSWLTLNGTYLFRASGFNVAPGSHEPKAIVEILKFNGDGTMSAPAATLTLNTPGGFVLVRSTNALGTYTLEANCIGTITFVPGPKFDVFTSPDGRVLNLIQTAGAPAGVLEGTARLLQRQ